MDLGIGYRRGFSRIYLTQFHGEYNSPSDAIQDLPNFSQGVAEDPGQGYETVESATEKSDSTTIEDDIDQKNKRNIVEYVQNQDRDLYHMKYKYESWSESEADVDGTRRNVHIPTANEVIVHWSNDGYLLFQGRTSDVDRAAEDLKERLDRNITFEKFEFDTDFFIWILYMTKKGEEIVGNLNLQNVFGGRLTDGESRTGLIRGSESEDTVQQLLQSILRGGDIISLRTVFKQNNLDFLLESRHPSSINIDFGHDLENIGGSVKMGVNLAAEYIDTYKKWDSLEPEQKYPEPSFLWGIHESAEDDDLNRIDDVVQEYSLKRAQAHMHAQRQSSDEATTEDLQNPRNEELFMGKSIADVLEIVESEIIEAKEVIPDQVDNIAREVAALANSRGGILVLGMADDGELVGLDDVRQADERVAGVIRESISPPVDVNIKRRSIASTDLLFVTVSEATETPRSVDGKYYKRIGTTVQELSPEELTRMVREGGEE